MNPGTLFALLALAGFIAFWSSGLRARDIALSACARACRECHTQLLDHTVALRRLALARNEDGRLVWRRTYQFEHSPDGAQRLRGTAVLHGRRLTALSVNMPEGVIHIESPVKLL